jgi:predicted SprT family Zn-dependent metalloprotease
MEETKKQEETAQLGIGAVSKRYICECGKKQTVSEMREEIGGGYTQYCCRKCGDVLIDDIKGVVYCNVC